MIDGFRFHAPVKVRFNETDLQGHVNFGQFYFFFDVGLTEYLEAIGYDYARMLAEGVDMLYVESHCRYHSPARWPEVLQVYTRLGRIGRRSLRFEFQVHAEADERKVAEGYIAAATVIRASFDPLPVPEALRRAAEAFEQTSFDGLFTEEAAPA